jgi:hypothetical protein
VSSSTTKTPNVPAPRRPGTLRPVIVPRNLLMLHGPWIGELRLPQDVCWSLPENERRWDLADLDQVAAAYAYVFDAGGPDDLVRYVNPWLLVMVWDRIPMRRDTRGKFERLHPVLRRHSAAAA